MILPLTWKAHACQGRAPSHGKSLSLSDLLSLPVARRAGEPYTVDLSALNSQGRSGEHNTNLRSSTFYKSIIS